MISSDPVPEATASAADKIYLKPIFDLLKAARDA
jgi:hypothetical protein